jgi:hypothetical protein
MNKIDLSVKPIDLKAEQHQIKAVTGHCIKIHFLYIQYRGSGIQQINEKDQRFQSVLKLFYFFFPREKLLRILFVKNFNKEGLMWKNFF